MKITNTEQANQYYKIVNDLVDKYIKKWKIKPSSLDRYLKPGSNKFESFIVNSGLSSIEGINRIVLDVIEDRKNMELDGVLTFESFKVMISESVTSVGSSSIDHEKAIADYYNTSLGHIEPKDKELHSFEVKDFGDSFVCVVYSEEEIDEIKKKLVGESLTKIKSKQVVVDNYIPYIYMEFSDIISEDKFKETYSSKLTEDKLVEIISNIIDAKFKSKFKGYLIWELV